MSNCFEFFVCQGIRHFFGFVFPFLFLKLKLSSLWIISETEKIDRFPGTIEIQVQSYELPEDLILPNLVLFRSKIDSWIQVIQLPKVATDFFFVGWCQSALLVALRFKFSHFCSQPDIFELLSSLLFLPILFFLFPSRTRSEKRTIDWVLFLRHIHNRSDQFIRLFFYLLFQPRYYYRHWKQPNALGIWIKKETIKYRNDANMTLAMTM